MIIVRIILRLTCDSATPEGQRYHWDHGNAATEFWGATPAAAKKQARDYGWALPAGRDKAFCPHCSGKRKKVQA